MSLKKLSENMKKSLKDDYVLLDYEDSNIDDVKYFVSTGCTALDYIMTNRRDGGVPIGKITSLAGVPHSGKTLLAIHMCANAQKMGGLCIYLNPENAFNEDFAQRVGLNLQDDSFWMPSPPPPTVEALFQFLFDLGHQIDDMKKKDEWPFKFVLVIWDSVASTPCKADLESENPDPTATVGLKPRVISKNLTTYLATMANKDIGLVCLNQLRTNIRAQPFQDPWVEPGGNAIPFYASIRLRISPLSKKKEKGGDEEIIGVQTQVKVEKTRFGPPFRKTEFPIYFTHGIDDPESIIDALEKKGGVKTMSGGPKGKMIYFEKEGKDSAIRKVDFKKMFLTDSKFKEKVMNEFERVMTRDLSDPRLKELEDVTDE